MKLSAKGRYAIKAMINIALNTSKEPKTLLQIAKHQGISLSYLEQLFALLRKHNLVSGIRGPGGGYKLSDLPENITIAQIINAINFIDGIDGLAISIILMFIISFQFFALVNSNFNNLSIIIVACLIPFYYFNFRNRNKVFLDDSG